MLGAAALALALLPLHGQETPQSRSEFALLVVEMRAGGQNLGTPDPCPGERPEAVPDEDSWCDSTLFEIPIRIVKRIAGPRTITGTKLRFTALDPRPFAGRRMLVIAYPNLEQGWLFAPWWSDPDEHGRVCIGGREAADLGIESLWKGWRARPAGRGEGQVPEMRCIRV